MCALPRAIVPEDFVYHSVPNCCAVVPQCSATELALATTTTTIAPSSLRMAARTPAHEELSSFHDEHTHNCAYTTVCRLSIVVFVNNQLPARETAQCCRLGWSIATHSDSSCSRWLGRKRRCVGEALPMTLRPLQRRTVLRSPVDAMFRHLRSFGGHSCSCRRYRNPVGAANIRLTLPTEGATSGVVDDENLNLKRLTGQG